MTSLRRRYRHARRHARLQRFHVAVFLTIVVLAYAGVPHVVRVVDSLAGYSPGHYEPKDVERETWVQRSESSDLFARIPWGTVVNVVLFLLVAVVWLTVMPTRASRRPPPG